MAGGIGDGRGGGLAVTISVAIGTYNRAAMAGEAVAAALAQSPDEIVVSDDASTDGTFERLSRDPRLRVFRQTANLGGARNASFAIDQTRGNFIAWCSDDDRFLPGHLAASVAYLKEHPEIGFVHSSFVDAIETNGHLTLSPRPFRSAEPLLVDARGLARYMIRYYNWPVHPSTIVMRRAVWEQAGPFDPAYALCDTDWFVRAVSRFPAAMLPRHGVINRRHAGNWSNRLGSAAMQREIFEIVGRRIPSRWQAIWRANVRLRLALTLRARLRTGHEAAARAAWHTMLQQTGGHAPEWIESAGVRMIDRWCAGREPSLESVSPL